MSLRCQPTPTRTTATVTAAAQAAGILAVTVWDPGESACRQVAGLSTLGLSHACSSCGRPCPSKPHHP